MAKNNSAIRRTDATRAVSKKRILIVDDHPMMREGLRGIINREPDLLVCDEADSARKALALVEQTPPDLALVDITLPGRNGLELVKDLKAARPDLAILGISMHDESLYAERMLRAGAKGYISKHQPPEELLKAIRQVLAGQIYLSREMSATLLQRLTGEWPETRPPVDLLTDREFEIFQLIGAGRSPKEIARQLRLSAKTVAVHNANIRQKLKFKTTAHLIRFAVQSENSTSAGSGPIG